MESVELNTLAINFQKDIAHLTWHFNQRVRRARNSSRLVRYNFAGFQVDLVEDSWQVLPEYILRWKKPHAIKKKSCAQFGSIVGTGATDMSWVPRKDQPHGILGFLDVAPESMEFVGDWEAIPEDSYLENAILSKKLAKSVLPFGQAAYVGKCISRLDNCFRNAEKLSFCSAQYSSEEVIGLLETIRDFSERQYARPKKWDASKLEVLE